MTIKLVIALLAVTIEAQQFHPYWHHSYDQYNLSPSCIEALNSKTACSSELGLLIEEFGADPNLETLYDPQPDKLHVVCADQCRPSLVEIRSKVEDACGVDATFTTQGSVFPVTYAADLFLAVFDTTCHKHRETGKVCEVPEWKENSDNDDITCGDCFLGRIKARLEHAVSYQTHKEEWLQYLVSKCKVTGYEFKKPIRLPYLVDDPTTKAGCMRPYTISEGDTLDSIARVQRVPTCSLRNMNQLADSKLPAVGATICLPDSCKIQWVDEDTTCQGIRSQHGVTNEQLGSWNLLMDIYCDGLQHEAHTYICVGPPETVEVARPANAAPGSRKCARWQTSNVYGSCAGLDYHYTQKLRNILFLNPDLEDWDPDCENVEAGVAYCIMPVGDITRYPEHPSQQPAEPSEEELFPWRKILPRAPGTDTDCPEYINAFDADEHRKTFPHATDEDLKDMNLCRLNIVSHHVTLAAFLRWNPSLDKENCQLRRGYSYCVKPNFVGDTIFRD